MNITNVYKIKIPSFEDERGILSSIEAFHDIPLEIKRIFYMHHIIQERGGHAHIETDQVIIPINGSFKVKVFDGFSESIFFLDNCKEGLFVPRLIFCNLFDFTEDAVCLVLANTKYDMGKSLRSLKDYLGFIKKYNE